MIKIIYFSHYYYFFRINGRIFLSLLLSQREGKLPLYPRNYGIHYNKQGLMAS